MTKAQKAARKAVKTRKARAAARKAVATRRARKNFFENYGLDTYDVVEAMVNGEKNRSISFLFGIPLQSVAAYRANFTRGNYGDCSFLRYR
jgi:FixJ family two-component response regulator